MTDVSHCLHVLICTDKVLDVFELRTHTIQAHFVELANKLLQQQTDEHLHQRLNDALVELLGSNHLKLRPDRANKTLFKHNFEEFLNSVKGFLLVK